MTYLTLPTCPDLHYLLPLWYHSKSPLTPVSSSLRTPPLFSFSLSLSRSLSLSAVSCLHSTAHHSTAFSLHSPLQSGSNISTQIAALRARLHLQERLITTTLRRLSRRCITHWTKRSPRLIQSTPRVAPATLFVVPLSSLPCLDARILQSLAHDCATSGDRARNRPAISWSRVLHPTVLVSPRIWDEMPAHTLPTVRRNHLRPLPLLSTRTAV